MRSSLSRCFCFLKLVTFAFFCLWYSSGFAVQKEIQMAILMPAPPKKIHENWQPLADYLAKKIGQPVKIVTSRGLKESRDAVGKVDFIYANSYLYSLLKQDSNVSAIAQMQNTGNSIYSQGRWLVRNDSPIKTAQDLKGKTVALISPYGAGSYLAPRAYLAKHGLDIDKDVKLEFTGNLKKAAYMVMLGEADTAVMCEVNYDILSSKIDTGDLRFIDKTDQFPEAVVFTSRDVNSDFVKRFRQALLDDTKERKVAFNKLRSMKIATLVPYDAVIEARIKELSKQAGLTP